MQVLTHFRVDSGTDTITDLSGSGATADILIVSSSATAKATGISSFTATSSTRNDGTAELTAASGGTIDMTNSAAGAYKITGSSGK